MKRITYEMLLAWEPCYEEAKLDQYKGMACTAVEVLRMDSIPHNDRLWVVLRKELLNARDLRLFTVRCARRTLAREVKPSPLLVACMDTAERYALGTATFEEMQAAWDAARNAARDAEQQAQIEELIAVFESSGL